MLLSVERGYSMIEIEGNHNLVEKLYFIAFIHIGKTHCEGSASCGCESCAWRTLAAVGASQGPYP